jgi:hypothetical protein
MSVSSESASSTNSRSSRSRSRSHSHSRSGSRSRSPSHSQSGVLLVSDGLEGEKKVQNVSEISSIVRHSDINQLFQALIQKNSNPAASSEVPPLPVPLDQIDPLALIKVRRPYKRRRTDGDANLPPALLKDMKKKRRKSQNREAAHTSRIRKKAYLTTLEKQVEELKSQSNILKDMIENLKRENAALRDGSGMVKSEPISTSGAPHDFLTQLSYLHRSPSHAQAHQTHPMHINNHHNHNHNHNHSLAHPHSHSHSTHNLSSRATTSEIAARVAALESAVLFSSVNSRISLGTFPPRKKSWHHSHANPQQIKQRRPLTPPRSRIHLRCSFILSLH